MNDVLAAAINPDGTLGPWTSQGTLGQARYSHQSAALGSSLYVLGGTDGTTYFDTIERALVNPDGTLQAFKPLATLLPSPRSSFGSVISAGHLYVAGGFNSVELGDLQVVPVLSSGLLGSFVPSAALSAREGAQLGGGPRALSHRRGHGRRARDARDTVERGPLDQIGPQQAKIGAFSSTSVMPTPRFSFGLATDGKYVYSLGGCITRDSVGCQQFSNTVVSASLRS